MSKQSQKLPASSRAPRASAPGKTVLPVVPALPAKVSTATNTFLANVFEGARKYGSAGNDLVKIIRARNMNWSDETQFKPFRLEYYLGRMAASLDYDRARVLHCYGLKPPSSEGSNGDKERTAREHNAYLAAKSSFSHVCRLAGQPNKVTGAARAARATAAAQNASKAKDVNVTSIMTGKVITPKITKPEDLPAFALRMAFIVNQYVQANSAKVTGDLGSALRAFVETTKTLASAPSPKSE